MATSSPSPRLTKTTSLAKVQALTARVQALVPTLPTDLSPSTVYEPAVPAVDFGTGLSGVGNVLLESNADGATSDVINYGVWVAPDVNGDGTSYDIQVECLGAGGGGGGSNPAQGAGGGGGGEYAAEPSYTVRPGESYVWVYGLNPAGGTFATGTSVASGVSGNATAFDVLGNGLPSGVLANGGQAGGIAAVGAGGAGGTGSGNTIHADGGAGASITSQAQGAGGGASGGSGGPGGDGQDPIGGSGGTGGVPPDPANNIATTTSTGGTGGAGGIAGGIGDSVFGVYAAGGGGGGDFTYAGGAASTAQVGFTAAATYNGTDSGAAAGAIYNAPQQGPGSVLFTGAGAGDASSGAKNSMLVIDPALRAILKAGSGLPGNITTQVSLTVFNANPASTSPVLLELGYSADTVLPASYTGDSIVSQLGALVMPAGATSATFDLTNTDFGHGLIDAATWPGALILGPGASPTFEAFGQPASPAFNAQVYGPGAVAGDGSSLAPFLTVTYVPFVSFDLATQTGGNGGSGAVIATYVDPEGTPVAGINAFATTDGPGNQWAAGFTGPITTWDPVAALAGTWKPESWHALALANGWASGGETVQYSITPDRKLHLIGILSSTSATSSAINTVALPAPYWPLISQDFNVGFHTPTGASSGAFGRISTAGIISVINFSTSIGAVIFSVLIPLDASL